MNKYVTSFFLKDLSNIGDQMGATTTEGKGFGSVTKVKPPIYNGVVKSDNISQDALISYHIDIEATGNITADGYIEAVEDVYVGGGVAIDGNIVVEGNINSNGSIRANGTIRGYAAGQLLNTSIITSTAGTISSSSTVVTSLASVSYTPVHTNSTLWIEYHVPYVVDGSGADDFRSQIKVDNGEITWRDQVWTTSTTGGAGTRSATVFPIAGAYTNANITAKTIVVGVERNGSDDAILLNRTGSVLRIQEYAN
jgi:hypothetical protein